VHSRGALQPAPRSGRENTRRTTTSKVFWRLPTLFKSIQQKKRRGQDRREIPADPHERPLVEYEGGGDESRSNPWLAELEQGPTSRSNPKAAADARIRNGE